MPAGTVIVPQPVSPVAKSAASSCEFALIGRRATWPMTWLGSPNAVAFRLATSMVWVVTMSAVTVTPRLMSRVAITVGSCVGGAVFVFDWDRRRSRSSAIPTNAMTARNTPMSRTRRFERFKFRSPRAV